MRFYRFSMRNASLILFWIAIIVAITTLGSTLGTMWEMLERAFGDAYADHSLAEFMLILQALGSSLLYAAFPFFGSAALYLLESHYNRSEVAK